MSIDPIPREVEDILPTLTVNWLKESAVSPIWSVRPAPCLPTPSVTFCAVSSPKPATMSLPNFEPANSTVIAPAPASLNILLISVEV